MEAIILLGAPGCGKGTVGEGLAKQGDYRHVSTGAAFRQTLEEGSPEGEAIRSCIESGCLVPDELVLNVVEAVVRRHPGDRILWDGFPRTLCQAKAFEAMLKKYGYSITHVVCFEISTECIVARLADRMICTQCETVYSRRLRPPRREGVCDRCGSRVGKRRDDDADIVRRRMAVYEEQTEPLVTYFETVNLLCRLDASQPPDRVLSDMEGILSLPVS